jgi:hypothetical protein
MKAWQAGIVVVVAAGNSGTQDGTDAMTIGVPANVPYVISVGAYTDAFTPANPADDYLPSFSAAGPTVEGFVKPDLVAPGGHIASTMHGTAELARQHPTDKIGRQYFQMTGTSMAAGVVSGLAALLLEAQPALSPDQVKTQLLAAAQLALTNNNAPAYTPFQQGAGWARATAAAPNPQARLANAGMNIAADLGTALHYGGPANFDPATGLYYIGKPGTFAWNGAYSRGAGYTWSTGYAWSTNLTGWVSPEGYTWSTAYSWSTAYTWSTQLGWVDPSGRTWGQGYTWSTGYAWSTSQRGNAAGYTGSAMQPTVLTWKPKE